jgi:hypothetical protein
MSKADKVLTDRFVKLRYPRLTFPLDNTWFPSIVERTVLRRGLNVPYIGQTFNFPSGQFLHLSNMERRGRVSRKGICFSSPRSSISMHL